MAYNTMSKVGIKITNKYGSEIEVIEYINKAANNYKKYIPEKLYNAIYNYKVEWED